MVKNQVPEEKIVPKPPAPQKSTPDPVKPNRTPMMVMAIVTVLSLLLSGYLVFQNNQLKQTTSSAKQTPLPVSSATPLAVANWSLYSFSDFGFSFSYPEGASVEEENRIDGLVTIVSINTATMTIKPKQLGIGFENPDLEITQSPLFINGQQLQLANTKIKKTTIFNTVEKTTSYMIIVPYPDQKSYSIMVTYEFSNGVVDDISNNLFDQILSTFEFLE